MIARWTPDTDHDGYEVDPGRDRPRTLAPRMPRYRPVREYGPDADFEGIAEDRAARREPDGNVWP